MRPLPYTRPAAEIPFYTVLFTWILLELRARVRSGRNPSARMEGITFVIVIGSIYLGVFGGFILSRHAPSAEIAVGRWAVFVAGIVLMCAGVVIRQWAVALLGESFTVDVRVRPGQTVVDRGPYRWLRHPSYLGLILTFVGIGLALGNWASVIVFAVVPTIGLVVRIHFEERVLLAGIGEPYRRFAATRKRLIPGVW